MVILENKDQLKPEVQTQHPLVKNSTFSFQPDIVGQIKYLE